MKVEKNKVVEIDYTLTDDDGTVLDTSDGGDPLAYLHGADNIIPGLESALDGKSSGDQLQVAVSPAEAYGERNEDLELVVARDSFEGVDDLEIGMQFRVDGDEEGDQPRVITVVEIDGDEVTVDGNHPLAGVNLNFDVTVRGIRDATAEELQHGHAHGAGCDH